jgi:2-phospho-L-lactate/phosphoenolpyruvate guanylyltransferase
MSCWTVIPVRARAGCKSRLAAGVARDVRRDLACRMLEHVLAMAMRAGTIERIVVVSPERDAVPPDIPVVRDSGLDLNAALNAARDFVLANGAHQLLVLPADLPSVTADGIDGFVAAGRRSRAALAPDRAGTGTNALYLEDPAGFRFCFGRGSRRRHESEAARHGIRPALFAASGFAADLDTLEDLRRWRQTRDSALYAFQITGVSR